MNYNYKCIVSKNGKRYYKNVRGKWKRISNAVGMKAEKGKKKYGVPKKVSINQCGILDPLFERLDALELGQCGMISKEFQKLVKECGRDPKKEYKKIQEIKDEVATWAIEDVGLMYIDVDDEEEDEKTREQLYNELIQEIRNRGEPEELERCSENIHRILFLIDKIRVGSDFVSNYEGGDKPMIKPEKYEEVRNLVKKIIDFVIDNKEEIDDYVNEGIASSSRPSLDTLPKNMDENDNKRKFLEFAETLKLGE